MIDMLARMASTSKHAKSQHAAALIKGGRLIRARRNTYGGKHAETQVMNGLSPDIVKGSKIWVVRIDSKGMLVNSRPCPDCYEALIENAVRQVIYSTSQGDMISHYI